MTPKAWLPIACLAVVHLANAGCRREMPFDLVPISGKVTYEDGALIESGSITVTFNPVGAEPSGGLTAPGAQTQVNVKDGSFTAVTTRRPDDGVIRGRHKVVVLSYDPRPDGRPMPNTAVPSRYRKVESTPVEVDVADPNQFVEIKVARR